MGLQEMMLRSLGGSGGETTALVSAYEAEQIIQGLHVTSLEKVGDAKFAKQHDAIQKLNLQAHWNAQQHTDEFVMDLLVSHDKLSVLVQELLVVEVWKEQLYPLLKKHLADHVDSSIAYLVLYHEAAVANLLEVLLYHRHACEAVAEDSLLELADWCMRKLAYLNTNAHKAAPADGNNLQAALSMSLLEELEQKRAETDFAAAICGLTILRYLTDHITQLPLGVMSRLLTAHDAVMALLPLVDAPPWVRSTPDGKVEKYIDGKWQTLAPADRLAITQLDGQVWLSLVNLLVEPACRAKYDPDSYRKSCIVRLQRHMHELLMDQLPVLRQLSRLLDELSLGVDSAAASSAARGAAAASRLIIEQVPVLRESLLRGKNWSAIAARQQQQQFGSAAKALAQQQLQSLVQSIDLLCKLEEQREQHQKHTASAGTSSHISGAGSLSERGGADDTEVLQAVVRVVCSRQVHAGGLWEPWCEVTAAVDPQHPSVPVSLSTADTSTTTTSSSSSSSSSGGRGSVTTSNGKPKTIYGQRYRLAAIQQEACRAFPTKGKVAVHFMGSVAEALLELPEVPFSRADATAAAGVPAGLWLTVGLLAADGFALQLRLHRADKPTERNKVDGGWYAFHPVGGAITVLSQGAQQQQPQPAGASVPAATASSGSDRKTGGLIKVISSSSSSGSSSSSSSNNKTGQCKGMPSASSACSRDTSVIKP